MKIRVFQSDKGDCLMITSKDGKRVLVDGGMSSSYSKHVTPTMKKLRDDGDAIDVVYVSHVDQDHIAGILKMADDAVKWKVYDFQKSSGNTTIRKPRVVRPPEFKQVWNNAFHDQVGDNADEIEDMLAARAQALTLMPQEFAQEAAEEFVNLAQSKAEAIRLSRRLGPKQLGIPINPEFDGGLMFITEPAETLSVGKLDFTVIGPFAEELDDLREEWNTWLDTQKAKDQLAKIRKRNDEDEGNLKDGVSQALGLFFAQASELGDRGSVTAANLASLMFHVKESGGPSVLLTGDGHWEDILAGLDHAGFLNSDGGVHVDVLKIQHHGSEHNWHHDFGKRVTADHYVFCGNGAHHNPELAVVNAVFDSRLGSASKKSKNAEVDNPFKLWFNSSSSSTKTSYKSHMKKLERRVDQVKTSHPSKVNFSFLDASHFDINL